MDGMSPFSTDQWIQQYPNIPMARSRPEPSDPTTVPLVYRDSTQGTSSQAGPKPIRRRSRASRRTPTTVLNASPTDFRALVQRFTGCDSNNEASSGLDLVGKSPRGPVTIDFARNDVKESSSRFTTYYDNNQQTQSASGLSDFQAGYGMNNNASSIVYESIDESTVMGTRIDGGSRGYNV